jgi:hypothetical protein
VHARIARAKGCRFVIDTDAHSIAQLDNLRWGVFQARRAGLTKVDVLNALPWSRFEKGLARPRPGASAPKPEAPAKTAKPPKKPATKAKTTSKPAPAKKTSKPSVKRTTKKKA